MNCKHEWGVSTGPVNNRKIICSFCGELKSDVEEVMCLELRNVCAELSARLRESESDDEYALKCCDRADELLMGLRTEPWDSITSAQASRELFVTRLCGIAEEEWLSNQQDDAMKHLIQAVRCLAEAVQ